MRFEVEVIEAESLLGQLSLTEVSGQDHTVIDGLLVHPLCEFHDLVLPSITYRGRLIADWLTWRREGALHSMLLLEDVLLRLRDSLGHVESVHLQQRGGHLLRRHCKALKTLGGSIPVDAMYLPVGLYVCLADVSDGLEVGEQGGCATIACLVADLR